MRVIVASSVTPFENASLQHFVSVLQDELIRAGHDTEVVLLPFAPDSERLLDQALAFRCVDLSHCCDRVIVLCPPAQLVKHPRKTLWLCDGLPPLSPSPASPCSAFLQQTGPNAVIQRYVSALKIGLEECGSLYVSSPRTREQLARLFGLKSHVLPVPLCHPEWYFCESFNGAIFYGSPWVGRPDQQALLEAMNHTRSRATLLLAAGAPSPVTCSRLEEFLTRRGLREKVVLQQTPATGQRRADMINHCSAVAVLPEDEFGPAPVLLEARQAGKPLLSVAPADMSPEWIRDRHDGLIAAPTADALATIIDEIVEEPGLAELLGSRGHHAETTPSLPWHALVHMLLE